MALQTINGGLILGDLADGDALPAFNGLTMDASGEKVAFVFTVPKTGNISKVGFRTGTVTTSETLAVTLQTVSAVNGDPTGSAYGGMTEGTQAAPAATTAYTVSLGTAAAATAGDVVAAVIEFDSSVGSLQIVGIATAYRVGFPYPDLFTAAWAKQAFVQPVLWLEYDDGSYAVVDGCRPWSAISMPAWAANSTPDEHALKFTLPFPSRLRACEIITAIAQPFDLVLYEGTTSLVSLSIDADQAATGSTCRYKRLLTSGDLDAGTAYYFAMKPTTNNNVSWAEIDVAAAAVMGSMSLGTSAHYASRTDGGAWSDTTTKRPLVRLWFDKLDDGAGGGGAASMMRPVSQSGGLV